MFVTSGIEQELENDYSKTFEQNSGLIESVGMNGYWLDFLAAKKRYIIEKNGFEREIIVDEFKTSLTDRSVGSLTFRWHYANPNNTVIDKVDIDITGLGILGPSTVNDVSNTAQFQVTYSPSNTTQRSITWSVVSGSDYASIDGNGKLTVKSNAKGNEVKIRATSTDKPNIYAEKSVNVTYFSAEVSISFRKDSIEVEAEAGTVTNLFTTTGLTNIRVSASGGMTITMGPSITGYLIGFAYAENTGNSAKRAIVTLTGDRTDGKGTFSKSYTVTQKAAAASAEDPSWDLPSSYFGEYLTLNPAGGTFDINISDPARAGWRVVFDSPLTLESGSATGTGQGKLSVRYPANDTGSSRSFELLLKSGGSNLTRCVAKQAAKAETPKAAATWELPATLAFEAGGDGVVFNITDKDSAGWRLTLPDWCFVSDGITEGSGDHETDLVARANYTGSARTGTVQLVSTDGNTVYATCTVTQEDTTIEQG